MRKILSFYATGYKLLGMKGIILAGGTGTRLWPLTRAVSKQLLPVYDKPLIYYPLSTLMHARIRDILVITTPHEKDQFEKLLGDGSQFGISLKFKSQPSPGGIAQAILIAGEYISGESVALILGDNIFYGESFSYELASYQSIVGAHILTYQVNNPRAYGVLEVGMQNQPVSLSEKPADPKSNLAVTGIYFFDANAYEYALKLEPSKRGELEIVDLLNIYLDKGLLKFSEIPAGATWLDCGTFESLIEASNLVRTLQKRSNHLVSSPEEIAFKNGWIDSEHLKVHYAKMGSNSYSDHINRLI
jgi:glucose-1-phosphate thymidylyltransferase